MTSLNNSNVPPLQGRLYIFDTTGGFTVEEGFQINTNPTLPLTAYDVTKSVQLLYSVRRLNDKLGIVKDEFNNKILKQLNWDETELEFNINKITVTSDEFRDTINKESIISLGGLNTLYSDFNYTVMQYFGNPLGFAELFNYSAVGNTDGGVFNSDSFIQLITGHKFLPDGRYINELDGSFTLLDISSNLDNAVQHNIFNNRCIHGADGSDEFLDITHGFIEGDLVYIKDGITVTLLVNIEPLPTSLIHSCIHNEGPENLGLLNNPDTTVNDKLNYTDTVNGLTKVTTYTETEIRQTYKVPILLILTNKDTFVIDNYGYDWINMTSSAYDSSSGVFIGDRNWLSISLSANGQYQSAVDKFGYIFTSNTFGKRWKITKQIAGVTDGEPFESVNNGIAVSMTGQYQVACDGDAIYVSNDYGETWIIKKSVSNKNVLVSISLNGQYQSVLSCSDNLYQSSDFGETWREQDESSPIFNSLSIFQYACISMSYDGRYQTLVCENVYVSSDYGNNWIQSYLFVVNRDNTSEVLMYEADEDWSDRNWSGVSISSEGKYQTAVNSGGDIFRSEDNGLTWYEVYDTNENIIDKIWTGISISANGRFQTAVDQNGTVHISTNYGLDWKNTPATNIQGKSWQAVSVSANGQYQSIVENGGGIYISNLY